MLSGLFTSSVVSQVYKVGRKSSSRKEDMGLHSLMKVLVLAVVFPVQVNLFDLSDYWDAWERLYQVVWVVVGQAGQEDDQYSGDWVNIEGQEE